MSNLPRHPTKAANTETQDRERVAQLRRLWARYEAATAQGDQAGADAAAATIAEIRAAC